ncbi:MAG: adenylate/guanylate cyclase domain-containing protein, partial [Verrucomicrobiales bacterium]|nr:adenylate/guanylate cyclase domain-containing protein [Verrucomicrobiales bacterium]
MKLTVRSRWVRILVAVLAAGACVALMEALWDTKIARQIENVTLIRRFEARAGSDPPIDPRIVIVGVDEESITHPYLGRWPWPRERHGELLREATKRKPDVVTFDFFFTEPSPDPTQDEAMMQGLELYPNALVGAVAERDAPGFDSDRIGKTESLTRIIGDPYAAVGFDTGLTPIEDFAVSAWTGFVNCPPSEVDGIRWRVPLVVRLGSKLFPSIALQTVMCVQNVRCSDVEVEFGRAIRFFDSQGMLLRSIPINERGELRLNFRSLDRFVQVGYLRLLNQLRQLPEVPWPQEFPPLKGQILMIGQTAAGLTDLGPTPMSSSTALVLVQATAVNSLLREDYLQEVPRGTVLWLWFFVAAGSLLLLRHAAVMAAIILPLALAAGYVALAFWQFQVSSLLFPLFMPVAGFIGIHSVSVAERLLRESRAKSRIKSMFGTYVSPEVVNEMVAAPHPPQLGGEVREITALFSDIASFSTFSEVLSAPQLVQLLNEYLGPLTDTIIHHDGTLDKYIGDAIVAMFGVPVVRPDHAYRACRSAVEMQLRLAELREKWCQDGVWPEVVTQMQTRIGMNSGDAVVGNMGSSKRFNYTMMGDSVNLAARCESGAKSYGVHIMITESTHQQATADGGDLAFRFLDQIVVKGRTQPVKIYEILGFSRDLPQSIHD